MPPKPPSKRDVTRLRRAIRASLRSQGFTVSKNGVHFRQKRDKRSIRKRHEHAVAKQVELAGPALLRHEDKLLRFIASGVEVEPSLIAPKLIQVEPDSEHSRLFRYACLHWSIPISDGYGTAYSRYPQAALLVIDPQGEFSKDVRGKTSGEYQLPLGAILKSLGKEVVPFSVRNLILDTWALFSQILFESAFFDRLSVPRGENRELACGILAEKLQNAGITLKNLHKRESFDKAWELLGNETVQKQFYRSEASRTRFQSVLAESLPDDLFNDHWGPVTMLFRGDRKGARPVEAALGWLFGAEHKNRPVLIVDLSREQASGMFWNDKIQALVIRRLLQGVTMVAESAYQQNHGLNTLVVIDEAHRLAPREIPPEDDEGKAVRATLIVCSRQMRS